MNFETIKKKVMDFLSNRMEDIKDIQFYDALRVIVNKDYRDEFQKETGLDIDRIVNWLGGESTKEAIKKVAVFSVSIDQVFPDDDYYNISFDHAVACIFDDNKKENSPVVCGVIHSDAWDNLNEIAEGIDFSGTYYTSGFLYKGKVYNREETKEILEVGESYGLLVRRLSKATKEEIDNIISEMQDSDTYDDFIYWLSDQIYDADNLTGEPELDALLNLDLYLDIFEKVTGMDYNDFGVVEKQAYEKEAGYFEGIRDIKLDEDKFLEIIEGVRSKPKKEYISLKLGDILTGESKKEFGELLNADVILESRWYSYYSKYFCDDYECQIRVGVREVVDPKVKLGSEEFWSNFLVVISSLYHEANHVADVVYKKTTEEDWETYDERVEEVGHDFTSEEIAARKQEAMGIFLHGGTYDDYMKFITEGLSEPINEDLKKELLDFWFTIEEAGEGEYHPEWHLGQTKYSYEKGYKRPGHKYIKRVRKRKPSGEEYYRYYYTRPYGERRPSIIVEPETKPEYGEEYMRVRITPTPKMRNTIKLIHNAFTKDEGGYWRMPLSAMNELLDRKLDILASPELMAVYDRYVSGAIQRNVSRKLKGVDIEPEVLKWDFDIFGLTKEKVETVANNLFGNKLIDQYDRQFLIKLRRKYDTFEELRGRRQRVKAISIQKDVNTMLSTRLDIKRDIFGKLNVSPTFDYDSAKETTEFKLPDYFSKDFNLTGGDLWDYEKKGCNWLLNQKRGLLGFGTGLGKTVISIASACKLIDAGKTKHVLCVVPSSRKEAWEEEIVRRTGKKVLLIDGTREKRRKLWRKAADYDFIVCSYDITRIDAEQIPYNKINCVIADESTRLRNLETLRTKSFRERIGGVEYLWFLSGTPIPNHPLNLFSQLAILNPAVLGSKRAFLKGFCIRKKIAEKKNTILGWKNMDDLHKLIKSYVFYKSKDAPDVNHDIPKFRSFSVKVDMGPKQADEYRKVLEGVVKEIEGMSEEEWNKRKGNMLKKIIRLEQIAISPALVPDSDWTGITPKLETAENIIQDKLSDEGGGVILFSFFKKPLQILHQDLLKKGLKESEISVVTGSTPKGSLLQLEKDVEAGKVRVVLASDALAEGTNLQYGLDTVINLNIPWSPGDFEQRYSRVVRQGQKRKVSVISLISKGTMEEGKLDQLKMKKSWIDRILNGKPGEDLVTELTKDDMLNILGNVGHLKEGMVKEGDYSQRRDPRFSPMVQESHEAKIKYINAYRDGQLDIVATASNNIYTVLVVEFIMPPQNPDAEAQVIYIRNDLPDYPVPIGWWMDWPEPRWRMPEGEYYELPREQRAEMECQEQLDKWIDREFNELFYGLYYTEEYDKWYWDEERTVPWTKEDREKLDEEFRERFSLDPAEVIKQSSISDYQLIENLKRKYPHANVGSLYQNWKRLPQYIKDTHGDFESYVEKYVKAKSGPIEQKVGEEKREVKLWQKY